MFGWGGGSARAYVWSCKFPLSQGLPRRPLRKDWYGVSLWRDRKGELHALVRCLGPWKAEELLVRVRISGLGYVFVQLHLIPSYPWVI